MTSEEKTLGGRVLFGSSWIAHEFKDPLSAVRTSLQYVLEEDEVGPLARDLIDRSCDTLDRFFRTIDAVIEWVKGTEGISHESFDLTEVVQESARPARPDLDRVIIDAQRPVRMTGAPELIGGAVSNLVRNALEYSPPSGRVTVSLRCSGPNALVCVDDEGPGVPPAEREEIFSARVRGSARRADRDGSGLGLFIARQAVEMHGGQIWVEPNGAGSSFRFSVPVRGVPGPSVF